MTPRANVAAIVVFVCRLEACTLELAEKPKYIPQGVGVAFHTPIVTT